MTWRSLIKRKLLAILTFYSKNNAKVEFPSIDDILEITIHFQTIILDGERTTKIEKQFFSSYCYVKIEREMLNFLKKGSGFVPQSTQQFTDITLLNEIMEKRKDQTKLVMTDKKLQALETMREQVAKLREECEDLNAQLD